VNLQPAESRADTRILSGWPSQLGPGAPENRSPATPRPCGSSRPPFFLTAPRRSGRRRPPRRGSARRFHPNSAEQAPRNSRFASTAEAGSRRPPRRARSLVHSHSFWCAGGAISGVALARDAAPAHSASRPAHARCGCRRQPHGRRIHLACLSPSTGVSLTSLRTCTVSFWPTATTSAALAGGGSRRSAQAMEPV
jgi:hypothetical protein